MFSRETVACKIACLSSPGHHLDAGTSGGHVFLPLLDGGHLQPQNLGLGSSVVFAKRGSEGILK
jgi:hypothetical protein